MKANRRGDLIDLVFSDNEVDQRRIQRGDFQLETSAVTGQRYFWFCCPGPCKTTTPILIRPVAPNMQGDSWELSGTGDAPTLTPSIHHRGCWHGWLKDGLFVSC